MAQVVEAHMRQPCGLDRADEVLVDRFAGHGNNKVIGSAGADQLL